MISKHKKKHKVSKSLPVIPTIRAPKGYIFKIQENLDSRGKPYSFTVRLFERVSKNDKKTEKYIGHVNLNRHWKYHRTLLTHSNLTPTYHNKGLGARMYARAIQYGLQHGYRVHSSGGSSDMAQRVWRGSLLRKYFGIKTHKQPGAISDKWYAYAKPKPEIKITYKTA